MRRSKEGQQAGLGLQPPLCPPLDQLWWRGRLQGQLPKVSSCARLLETQPVCACLPAGAGPGPEPCQGAVGCVAGCLCPRLGLPKTPCSLPWSCGGSEEVGGTDQGLNEWGLYGAGGAVVPEWPFLGVRLLGPNGGPVCHSPACFPACLAPPLGAPVPGPCCATPALPLLSRWKFWVC